MEWQDIGSVPKDETEILVGNYYVDNCGGYYGESRWLWIVQGSYDEYGNFWDNFNDEATEAGHMTGARRATHWKPIPKEKPNG